MSNNKENIGEGKDEVAEATPVVKTQVVFTNDFTDADKEVIRAAVAKNVEEILEIPALSANNLSHLAQVAHGSITSRARQTISAREIVLGVISGTRATRTPSVNTVSVKSFIDSLSPEDKQKMLDDLLG